MLQDKELNSTVSGWLELCTLHVFMVRWDFPALKFHRHPLRCWRKYAKWMAEAEKKLPITAREVLAHNYKIPSENNARRAISLTLITCIQNLCYLVVIITIVHRSLVHLTSTPKNSLIIHSNRIEYLPIKNVSWSLTHSSRPASLQVKALASFTTSL